MTHPNMFLNQTEIDVIKMKINNNQNPWKAAWDNLLSTDINEAMNTTSYPNVYNSVDGHTFKDYAGYINTGDYSVAIKMGRCVRALGLAYAMTGNSSYADKAISFIKTWCFNDDTYMLPKIGSGTNHIYIYITIPGMLYGADLIWNYSAFQSTTVTYHKNDGSSQSLSLPDAIKAWAKDLATYLLSWDGKDCSIHNTDTDHCQNYENWRVAFQMACAAINNDTTKMIEQCDRFKYLIPYTIDTTGRMTREYNRYSADGTKGSGLSYSLYAINAMIQAAEIVRHHPELNTDLYAYKTSDGRGFEKALDFVASYCYDVNMPQAWRNTGYPQTECESVTTCSSPGCKTGNMGLWELAYKYYGKSAYNSVITTRGRPMYESRNMGPTTLTHSIDISQDCTIPIVNMSISIT